MPPRTPRAGPRRAALVIGAALVVGAAAGAAPPATAGRPPAPRPPAVDVVELTVAEATRRMDAGELTARALTEAYLARIDALDRAGPHLGAILSLNPAALADADALDAERRAGHVRGPLHGIPVVVKDNIDVAGLVTSAGSLALADNVAAADAPLVARLRAAGAIVLAKTNLSEWANFRSTRSVSGWSSLGGQTRNPYVLDRNPCGSSSGTAVAVAASLAMVGVGTETDGSIQCPSAVNGIVGLKPTVGRVSQAGIVPISAAQDTAGPMARTVADAAVLYAALAGVDAPALDAPLTGVRIGVVRGSSAASGAVDPAYEAALAVLAGQGATLVDPVAVESASGWGDREFEAMVYEFKEGVEGYLAASTGAVRSLDAVIAWNLAHADRAMPWFGQELLELAAAKGPADREVAVAARAEAQRLATASLAAALDGVDVLVAPTTGPSWVTDVVCGDHFGGEGYSVAAVAGTPSLTVPMGAIHELPLGLTFLAATGEEGRLLAVGAAFERASPARRAPRYLPTVGAPPGTGGDDAPPTAGRRR